MKARVKDTGRLLKNIVPVMSIDDKLIMFHENGTDDDYYYFEQLDFNDVIDWDQIRNQAAIAAMQGMLSNPQTFEQIEHDERYKSIRGGDKTQIIAIASVMYADELINELKRTEERGTT